MPETMKKFEIIVNGRPKPWNEDTINYSQVVDLAFPPPHKSTEVFTVEYSHGLKENRQGTRRRTDRARKERHGFRCHPD